MRKTHSLLLAFLLTSLLATNLYFFTSNSYSANKEKVNVLRVIDGDTLELEDGRKVRLANINSPEKISSDSNISFKFLKTLEGKTVELEVVKSKDKYNRVVARIFSPEYANLEIIKKGLANKFLVSKEERRTFAQAEKYAIDHELGIWQRSKYYDCFSASIDSIGEIVYLKSKCGKIDMRGWRLKDESREELFFPEIKTDQLIINSSSGRNTEKIIYWGSSTPIWNNDEDSLYLRDKEGKLIHYETYSN